MALITDFGVTGTQGGILQPKQKNKWRLDFTIGNQAFTLQAVTVQRPKLKFEEIQLDRYNSRGYIAGKYTWEPCQAVYEDDTGGLISNAIQAQLESQEHIIAVDADATLPASAAGQLYKFGVKLTMMDGNSNPFEEWVLDGAWFSNIDWGDLDYASGEAVKVTLTIRFDHARQSVSGTAYNMNNGSTPL